LGLWLLPVLIPVGIYFAPAADSHHFFYINPVFRVIDFLIGILLFNVYEKIKLPALFKSTSVATIAEIIAIGSFVLFFSFHLSIEQGYRYSCYYWLPVMLVIFVFAQQAGYLSKLLSGKVLVLAGEISFSFYLLHQLLMKYISFINAKFFIIHSEYLLVAIIFIVSVITSYGCYRFIEIPSNRFIKAKYKVLTAPALNVNIA
jgi:peptidoglycan/LPS O-acetylase OafA/YrhL